MLVRGLKINIFGRGAESVASEVLNKKVVVEIADENERQGGRKCLRI